MFRIGFLEKSIIKIFDIKKEELQKTLLMQLNIFLLITTLLIVKPTINSLFLLELTADALPVGYVLTAITAVIGSFFYDRALENFSLNIVQERTLTGSILFLLFFGFAFNFNIANGLFLYIPYIWVAIFGLLTASQFWILANLVYNVREAKRVFGFIGAGAIAGGIFGGYLTSLIANFISTENLLFVAAFLLVCCLFITKHIWKNEVVKLSLFQLSLRKEPKSNTPFKLIKQSRLLSLIAIVIGISVLVAKLVDYQYSDYASRFIEDPEELASFFGFWLSTLSVISLLIQLFLTKRVVGTFGVGKSLLWLPSGILIGSLLLLFLPQLWVVVFIKIIDGSLKQSINKAATELLSIPIPIDIKKKTKTFIDVVVDSIATGLAGFILIFFINALDVASTYVSFIIVVLISLWLFFIYKLRKEYITSFRKLLENSDEKKEKINRKEIPITSIIETVKKVFTDGSEGQILYMLGKTFEVKDERFFFEIKELLKHKSAKVRAMAIDNLYYLKTENLNEDIEPMVHDSDQQVTTMAFRYLLKNYSHDTVDLFNKYVNDSEPTISNAALIGLSLEVRNNLLLQEKFNLNDKLREAINQWNKLEDPEEKNNKCLVILEAIGSARASGYYYFIEEQLKTRSIQLLNAAILSASKTLDQIFIDRIISYLSGRDTRKSAIEALFHYGEPIMDILLKKINEQTIGIEDANYVPLVIEKFASQKAVNTLIKLTDNTEHNLKIEAIEAIRRLKWKYSHLFIKDQFVVDRILDECDLYQSTLSAIYSQIVLQYKKDDKIVENEARKALIKILEQRLDRQLQRIFRFLGIKYPPADVDPVLDIILKGKEEQRAHAIEFLDNILDNQLKKELIPIAETILIDAGSEEKIRKLNIKAYSEEECYRILLQRNDIKLKQVVLQLIEKTNNKKLIPLVETLLVSENDKIKKQAMATLGVLTKA